MSILGDHDEGCPYDPAMSAAECCCSPWRQRERVLELRVGLARAVRVGEGTDRAARMSIDEIVEKILMERYDMSSADEGVMGTLRAMVREIAERAIALSNEAHLVAIQRILADGPKTDAK